ncbi:hypothetical protein GCM10011578_099300 [Streptomyces fuscichromogenes]|uniref:Transposase n=1 Tax=Streptomyces fuscichromogenes TaxID=1324013 RepID=A0A918CXV4_9ACTN|nr:hypothetical protein GCM10011578_099300 [Streptomyces fuscichromogenes]
MRSPVLQCGPIQPVPTRSRRRASHPARWSAGATWERALQAVRAKAEADASGRVDCSMASEDSTVCRVHQHAAGAPKIGTKGLIQRSHRRNRGSGSGRAAAFDRTRHVRRKEVDRTVSRIKNLRAVATRYEKRV